MRLRPLVDAGRLVVECALSVLLTTLFFVVVFGLFVLFLVLGMLFCFLGECCLRTFISCSCLCLRPTSARAVFLSAIGRAILSEN